MQPVRATHTTPLFETIRVSKTFGVFKALSNVSFHVSNGEFVSIVGPNGAGKTSLLAAIAGLVPTSAGVVSFAGEKLTGIALEAVVARGLALVPEGRRIFASLTVAENLALGATARREPIQVRADIERFYATFPILGARRRQPAGLLSGGEQQQLAIARALVSRPRLLMLDEPSLGLAPAIVDQVYGLLREIRTEGVTILLVEQNADRAFALSDRTYVMRGGEIVLHGRPATLKGDPHFDAAYFGIGMAEAAR